MTARTKNKPRAATAVHQAGHAAARGTRPGPGPSLPKARPPKARRPDPAQRSAMQRKRKAAPQRPARVRSHRAAALWLAGVLVVTGLVTAAMLASRPASLQHSTARAAPGFTLPATDGKLVSLASYRGHDVVLYFSEGAGCDACFYQMREFEQHAAQLARAGITILPIVMNPASQIRPYLATFGLRTPYLIDADGAVSRAYGVFGKGMHAGLPGHGFVLVDARGIERWYGEYPSMWLPAASLIRQVHAKLGGRT